MGNPDSSQAPTRVRFIVLGFACALSMITYIDRACFGVVSPYVRQEFELNKTQEAILFAAFLLAYSLFEVPSGWMGDRFGARNTLVRIVAGWSIFTALTGMIYPSYWGALTAFWLLVTVRFCFGAGEAGAYPNLAKATHLWFPFRERGMAQGAVWMASRLAGGLTPLMVTSLFIEGDPVPGIYQDEETRTVYWRHVFWLFGAIGLVWCIFFWWWFRDRPEQKASVNAAERELIRDGEILYAESHRGVPWGHLFRQPNLWVLCALYFCLAFSWYFNMTWLPGFLMDRFGISQQTIGARFGLLAGAPMLCGCVGCLIGGLLSDYLIRKTGSRKWGRRMLGVVGYSLAAFSYFASIYAANAWSFVLAICLVIFWADLAQASAWASCLDIGRHYSGIVAGCMNTIGNLGGFTAMMLTGYVLDNLATTWEVQAIPPWNLNFIIYGVVFLLGALLWLVFDATQPVVPTERK